MFTVIVTEKPSVAQEYIKTLKVKGKREDGYVRGYSEVLGKEAAVTWCIGHLCALSYPERYDEALKKWSMETLPFLPEEYLYEVIPAMKKQFGIIKKFYHSKDLEGIYYAGDAGREGLYIQMLVRQLAGTKTGIWERVVWIDSYTEPEIIRGIREAKELAAYERQKDAAYMRAIEDYAAGINFSRALAVKFGNAFKKQTGSDKAIAVGRVMTCVLAMVVERERQIRGFRPTPFYGITADIGCCNAVWRAVEGSKWHQSSLLYNESGFLNRSDEEELLRSFAEAPEFLVESVKESTEKKKAPLLFNLAEVQFFCTKKYKISPGETLSVIQTLYEKKLVTYPRTDARVMSTAVALEVEKTLMGLRGADYRKKEIGEILSGCLFKGIEKSRYVDDSKITDHYAIIPTGITAGSGNLADLEKKIYCDIVDRFLAVFLPAAEYRKVEVVLEHSSKEKFFVSEKVLVKPGYQVLLGKDEEDRADGVWTGMEGQAGIGGQSDDNGKKGKLFGFKKGQKVGAGFAIHEGETKAPKRYTSGSMVIAMENAGNLIEDDELRAQIKGCGIGTSATRAATIEKLVKKCGYLGLAKSTQILTPTNAGECVYDIVKRYIPGLASPEMTASWEKGLAGIESGKVTIAEYREKFETYVRREVEKIKAL